MSPAAIVRTRFAASGLLAAVLTGMPLRAQETRYVKEGDVLVHTISGVLPGVPPKLSLQTDLGSVRIAGGAGSALRYRITVRAEGPGDARARRDLDAMAISVAKGGARVLFKGQLLEPDPELSAEFELTVPRDLQEIDVATGAGDVDLRGLAGRASITTRGGVVIGDDLGGPLSVATEGGDIRIGTARSGVSLQSQGGSLRVVSVGGDLVARSAGGDVIIGAAGGQVRAETGGGNVRIDSAAGDVTAATGGGNIEIGQVRGRVASTTGGGSIRVASATAGARCETGAGMIDLRSIEGPVSARTSSGNIRARLTGAGVRSGESDLQSRQGDVTVLLSESLPLTIRAFADGAEEGSIRSDFPLRIGRDTGTGGRTAAVAEGTIGRGGSLLKIRAVGGSIVILKADKKHD